MTDPLGQAVKDNGWRVEVFWNAAGCWFTARLISFPDGDLRPEGDPVGASGRTPQEAIAALRAALEQKP